jgi:long-chain acyl-CoA synthetase
VTISAPASTAGSVGVHFLARCARSGHAEAFRHPAADGSWTSLTWRDLGERTTELAAGLLALGVGREQRVAIASSTRIEWVLADLAVVLAGAVTTTVYPSTGTDDVAYILGDCAAVVVFAENAAQVAQLRADGGWVGQVRYVVAFEPVHDPTVLSLDDLAARGREHLRAHPGSVSAALDGIGPGSLATLVYTSGTTGRPKGVELTHGNWLYLGAAIAEAGIFRPEHVHFLWLPLSHVFGKLLLAAQYELGFVTAIDGRVDRIIDNLAVIRPHATAAVPRILEKIRSSVVTTAGSDQLVAPTVRARLGGRLEVLLCGSAALAPQIAEWFAAAGLPVLEGYGLTETTGASFVNRPGRVRIGTVGQPLPGTDVRIADDGEILLRSPGIMRGYHGLPEKTAEVLDADGWFATGDIGELDAEGYLRITDRKKDLVKTSGGKYIAPTTIESAVKAACPLVGNAVVVADGRNFASLLVTVDQGATSGMTAEAVDAALEAAIAEINAGLNRWETIKQYRILPRELTVEAGEVTPSLKIKRAVVARNHADLIESIYARTGGFGDSTASRPALASADASIPSRTASTGGR